ncbi:gamma-glutamyltransferase family protein [Oleiharenicola lentus]|uniref:gamma-glutamyltransferase family protein n=1 Tax=Oleiharenicola lentus TaxID=2508720 RepID=UPI003F669E57
MSRFSRPSCYLAFTALASVTLFASVPVKVTPVTGKHGMVVAGHPQAAQAGVEILRAGGNAVDAAVAVSLALGVAEPYGSGLGGKLMLMYYEASSGKTYAVDAMDAAGSLDVASYLKTTDDQRAYGYTSVAVPGLPAGLWTAQQKWGKLKWADTCAPAIALAREGFEILPKTRDFFAEQEKKLRRGDAEIARLYLPNGELPVVGSKLPNPELAATMTLFAQKGRDGFYRGPIAGKIVAAAKQGGGVLTLDDFAGYEARIVEPLQIEFRGYRLLASPPPTNGAPLFLTILKALEAETFTGPLRSAENLDKIGRVWRVVQPKVQRAIADVPDAAFNFEKLVAPDSIAEIRQAAFGAEKGAQKVAWFDDSGWSENYAAATTHFAVVDAQGNIVCATQSQSLHFGAGVVAPGTGVVLNDSMSNFAVTDPKGVNYVAPGKRPRSTIAPTIAFKNGKPVFAIGIPGAGRIPTALLQALLDRLAFDRPFTEAIGDTRFHFERNWRTEVETIEAEKSLPASEVAALTKLGWKVSQPEAPGTGRYFGGINVVEINADGTYTGYADPRRTNAAVGYDN